MVVRGDDDRLSGFEDVAEALDEQLSSSVELFVVGWHFSHSALLL